MLYEKFPKLFPFIIYYLCHNCGFEIKYNDGDEQVVQLYKEPEKDVVYLDG